MLLSKKLKMKPHDIASMFSKSYISLMLILSNVAKIQQAIAYGNILSTVDVAGPGFINLKLSDSYIKNNLKLMLADPNRLNVRRSPTLQRIIVDFSSPNIAKVMHVVR